MLKKIILISLFLTPIFTKAQETGVIKGIALFENEIKKGISINLNEQFKTNSNEKGEYSFSNVPIGSYTIKATYPNASPFEKNIYLQPNDTLSVDIDLFENINNTEIEDIVISATMKPVSKLDSPVNVEVYDASFFKKNPTTNLIDALQNINGVRPQINCNVCNTGDIRINGLDGAYTMVLIDGMPIVSSLGTVYGLSGIPTSLIERIEVVKGPASSLYGSEAVAGLINIITKKSNNAPLFSIDAMSNSHLEHNIDASTKLRLGNNIDLLTGINYFNFQNLLDKNNDQFTDVTQQHRISIFQKWNFKRKSNKLFNIMGRYLYEDRWGGDIRWNKSYRGGDEIYAESIYTNRAELIGSYQLPTSENIFLNFSLISHNQNSRYGDTSFNANQKIAFTQLTWDKTYNKHSFLLGSTFRYTYYDDNTIATESQNANQPEHIWLPGIFVQDEITLKEKHQLLLGLRYDYNNIHKNIFTPRIAYKWMIDDENILRINAGTGFRIVNLFTEDHASLTGAREVVISNNLHPEKSYNVNVNFIKKFHFESGSFLEFDASTFYTYFTNRIVPDYETNHNQIIYNNINGYAISKGISLNTTFNIYNGPRINIGATLLDNHIKDNDQIRTPLLTEKFSASWSISHHISQWNLSIDYTGNLFSPMKLPLAGELDPRPSMSPWWSIQNIQFTYKGFHNWEIYSGVKNLLNWTPYKKLPFLIARTNDPFDKEVVFDNQGNPIATPNNPYALTFDPTYAYAPNQGARVFLGVRFHL